ncbi:MAG TPA: apolipoprotein N-acyltransferase [Polyangiaceae bacterium]|nr:apolipoprotein N-acyltransferase [Polyangiaceae bacterium]
MVAQQAVVTEQSARPTFVVRHRSALLAAGGGAVSALATPPTDLYPCMIVGLAMLAFAMRDSPRFRHGFLIGWLWGAVGQLVGMRFVPSVITLFTDLGVAAALLAHLLLSAAQSLHWALGIGAAVALRRRVGAPLELAFAAGMLIAVSLPSIFVWTPAGLLSPWPVLVQSAELIGERGTSVLFAVIAALCVRGIDDVRRHGATRRVTRSGLLAFGGAAALLVAMLAHGAWAMSRFHAGEHEARIALIHGAVDPRARWEGKNWSKILSELRRQTAFAEAGGVELSVWPEAAYPYALPHGAKVAPRGQRGLLGGTVQGPILFGLIMTERPERLPDGAWHRDSYNSASIVMPDGTLQPSYDKMELLWFGETVPLGEQIPWLKRTFQRSGGLIRGTELRGLTVERDGKEPLRMAVLNCYEDTLPTLGRRMLRELQPNLLVNVTNDAWFIGTAEPELHARLGAMRSIELRRDLVRAVNLGVSGWIDAAGRVQARSASGEPDWMLVTPTLRNDPPTIYARAGDIPMWTALLLGVGACAWNRRRSGRAPPTV